MKPLARKAFLLICALAATALFIGVAAPCPDPPLSPSVSWQCFYAGMPIADESIVGDIQLLDNIGFVVGYSNSRKNPLWVCYQVCSPMSCTISDRSSSWFKNDTRTTTNVSTSFDYATTGLDRGHLAPNSAIAACYGPEAQRQTFLMTNISPQPSSLNQGPWKDLEDEVKQLASLWGQAWVITGAVFDDVVEMLPSTAISEALKPEVPDAFYKIIIYENTGSPVVLAYLMSKDVSRSAGFEASTTSMDAIESLTGLDFLWMIEDELESSLEMGLETAVQLPGQGDDEQANGTSDDGSATELVIVAALANAPGSQEIREEAIFLYNTGSHTLDLGMVAFGDEQASKRIDALPVVSQSLEPGGIWGVKGCVYNSTNYTRGIALRNSGETLSLSGDGADDKWNYGNASGQEGVILVRAGYEHLREAIEDLYGQLLCP